MASNANAHDIIHRSTCRICDSTELDPILSLGPMALANSFLKSPAEFAGEAGYPLDVYFCRHCSLLQLLDVVNPEVLFRHYVYVTGMSSTMAVHNRDYAKTLVDLLHLSPDDLVVEVASNDGSLLRCFVEHGVRTLGVDPARNLAAEATASGIETIPEFFTADFARELRRERGAARAIVAIASLTAVSSPTWSKPRCNLRTNFDRAMMAACSSVSSRASSPWWKLSRTPAAVGDLLHRSLTLRHRAC